MNTHTQLSFKSCWAKPLICKELLFGDFNDIAVFWETILIKISLLFVIRYIQELLGHNSSKTTEFYTHVTNKHLQKIKSPLDNLDI